MCKTHSATAAIKRGMPVTHTTLFYNWMGFVTCKEARHNAKQTLNTEILKIFKSQRFSFHG